MSMTDPFLPEQGVPRDDGDGAVQPEDFDHEDESEPDVWVETPVDDVPVSEDGEPPALPSVFNTPTGGSIDPSHLG